MRKGAAGFKRGVDAARIAQVQHGVDKGRIQRRLAARECHAAATALIIGFIRQDLFENLFRAKLLPDQLQGVVRAGFNALQAQGAAIMIDAKAIPEDGVCGADIGAGKIVLTTVLIK